MQYKIKKLNNDMVCTECKEYKSIIKAREHKLSLNLIKKFEKESIKE